MAPNGKAFYGGGDEWSVLALKGDIRFTLIQGLEAFIEAALDEEAADTMLVDLRKTNAIDSTGIGLLARIAGRLLRRKGRRAILLCPSGDVRATLCAVDFEKIFDIVDEPPRPLPPLEEIPTAELAEKNPRSVGRVVLDAHQELMEVSEGNRREFGPVVDTLEREVLEQEKER